MFINKKNIQLQVQSFLDIQITCEYVFHKMCVVLDLSSQLNCGELFCMFAIVYACLYLLHTIRACCSTSILLLVLMLCIWPPLVLHSCSCCYQFYECVETGSCAETGTSTLVQVRRNRNVKKV